MNDSALIEEYIFRTLSPEDRLIVDARLLTDITFTNKFKAQQLVYDIINEYGRKQLRSEIQRIETSVFSDHKYTSFRRTINKIFNL